MRPRAMSAADGKGGAYLTWVDGRVRVLRIGPDLGAAAGWPADGWTPAAETGGWHQLQPTLISDGGTGVYVAWIDQDEGFDLSLRLTRLRADGRPDKGWPATGLRVAGPSSWVWQPALAPMPGGGVAVAWSELAHGDGVVRAIAFDGDGQPARHWPADGLVLGMGRIGHAIELVSSARGGLFATWGDLEADGVTLWIAAVSPYGVGSGPWPLARAAIPVGSNMGDRHPELAADGYGGALIVWTDATRGRQSIARDLDDVLAQRMSPAGALVWSQAIGAGHVIAAGAGEQRDPHLVEDGLGGGLFTWNAPGWGGIQAEGGRLLHLDELGRPAAGWTTAGISLGTEVSGLYSDLAGGVWVSSFDGPEATLRHFPRGWSPASPLPGALSLGSRPRESLLLCPDLEDGAFLAWQERAASQVIVRIEHVFAASGSPVVSAGAPFPSASPLEFAVYPIRPNPARAECRIEFELPVKAEVDIEVFDITGRRVARLAKARIMDPGPQSVSWRLDDRDGRLVPAGLYLVRVLAGTDRAVVRMAVTR
jgi:hypothetical protein